MNKTALITGPTSGIGLELAKVYAKNGHDLVLVARSRTILETLKRTFEQQHNIRVIIFDKDLGKASSCQELFDQLQQEKVAVDILVNNAGFGSHGYFHESDLKTQMDMMSLNVVSLTQLTRLFLPAMVERQWGRVLNVASTAAFQPGPFMAVYYASKAFVLSFSEALDQELKDKGVRVTALCPGPVHTGFSKRAGMDKLRLFNEIMVLGADKVAQIGYEASQKGKPVVIAGFKNKVLAFSNRLAPRGLVSRVVKRINSRPRLK